MATSKRIDVVIVGAGLAGLYALYRLRGQGLACQVYEAGSGIGGTWFWNRYPGARCDIESLAYSYSFSPELERDWEWKERYGGQREILAYVNHVADRFDLRRDIQLETRVESTIFDDESGRWRVCTDRGEEVDARFCVMATGCLSVRNVPKIPGLERFEGPVLHTGDWPEAGVDLEDKRVGIIGTGSSAIQAIPLLAEAAGQLFVFQRTANYSMPAFNIPMSPRYQARVKSDYASFREFYTGGSYGLELLPEDMRVCEVGAEERAAAFEKGWKIGGFGLVASFPDVYVTPRANEHLSEFLRTKIRATVADPKVAELLCPDSPVGCKRPCADTNYYETFNRANVTLVDIRNAPFERVAKRSLVAGGREYELDVLVLATGFDAMTGALQKIDIRGRGERTLRERWAEGPKSYLGLGVDGFPNFFTITGPGSPSVLANMIPAIEQHVDWIAELLAFMQDEGHDRVEPETDAVESWVAHTNEIASRTIFPTCNSWYLGANIPGKPRVFMPYIGFRIYTRKCDEIARDGYRGFVFGGG